MTISFFRYSLLLSIFSSLSPAGAQPIAEYSDIQQEEVLFESTLPYSDLSYLPRLSDYLPVNDTEPTELSGLGEVSEASEEENFPFSDETGVDEDEQLSMFIADAPKSKTTVYCYITKKNKILAEHYFVFCIYRTPGEKLRLLALGLVEDSDIAHAVSLLGKDGFPEKTKAWFRFIGQFGEERAGGSGGIITKAAEYSNQHPLRSKDAFLLRALASPFLGYPCLEVALGVESVILKELKK